MGGLNVECRVLWLGVDDGGRNLNPHSAVLVPEATEALSNSATPSEQQHILNLGAELR